MAMSTGHQPFRALIVGGGVAGLEAALALRQLAGDRVSTTLLAPEATFAYRPMRVREPFAGPGARVYRLDEIAHDIGVELMQDAFKWLEPERRVVHTELGDQLAYDALLIALGARARAPFAHALTLDDRLLDDQLHGLVQDVEAGLIHKIAFVAPSHMPWPLPLYELALLTARRAWEMRARCSVTVVTPEDRPLALFGTAASEAVERELVENGVLTISATLCSTPAPGEVLLHPGGHSLYVDRVVTLPELFGPATPGVPKQDGHGFVPIDSYCRVPGLEAVFAAGDATAFPVKHGGIAAQQADVAAAGIAALAGARVEPRSFQPEVRGILLTGGDPLYLSARVTGNRGSSSRVSATPLWSPATKIAAEHLAPYLQRLDEAPVR